MKLSNVIKALIVSGSVLSLAACSALHHGNTHNANISDAGGLNGAQTSGLGDDSMSGASYEERLAKRIYYFEFNRSQVQEADRPAIDANANNLVTHPSAKILLEGHTDPRGSREYNVALGERRAQAVADMLKAKGVNPDQIRVISYGAERLASEGRDESAYQQDRRVVLVYLQQ